MSYQPEYERKYPDNPVREAINLLWFARNLLYEAEPEGSGTKWGHCRNLIQRASHHISLLPNNNQDNHERRTRNHSHANRRAGQRVGRADPGRRSD